MPPTRKATVSRRAELDIYELMELMCGPEPPIDDPDGEGVSVWPTDDDRRADWERHKDREPLRTQRARERDRGDLLWAEARYGS